MASRVRKGEVAVGIRAAFFGSTTLLAREMRAILETRGLPVLDLKLYDDNAEGAIAEFDGEALLVGRPDEDFVEGLDLAFMCGSSSQSIPYIDWPARHGYVAIDASGAASGLPGIPLVHTEINPGDIMSGDAPAPLIASPHPISHNIATLGAALASVGPVRRIETVSLMPASDLGEPGIQELYGQTLGLLNFSEVPKDTFGRQIAFNVLTSAGEAPDGADALDGRLRREIAALLGMPPAAVLVRAAYAPVFHGHAHCVTTTFDEPVDPGALEERLGSNRGITIVKDAREFSPVDLAGQESVAVHGLRVDALEPARVNLWGFCDNLKGGSCLNAIRIAERVIDLRRGGPR